MSITLYGFDGSTYVRTVRMLLAEKGATGVHRVPLNVLTGEPKQPEHLARHPFGKVPVLEHDGFRIIETAAIVRYLDAVLPGPSLVPADPKARARMDMVVGLVDSYGYGALLAGVAGYHLFPDFVGGQNEAARQAGIANGRMVLEFAMRLRQGDGFIAGPLSLAELYLAPILAYVAMTPDADAVLSVDGVPAWWQQVQALPSFVSTPPS